MIYAFIKILLIITLFIQYVYAEEHFVALNKLKLAHITLTHKYCKDTKENRQLCKHKKLSYIDYDDSDLPHFLRDIRTYIKPHIKAYTKNNLKDSTLLDIKEYDGNIAGDWNEEKYIELFAKTPATYTLSNSVSGYAGGAHGYYGVALHNFNIETQKKVTLEELFISDSNETLHTIAQKHYKRIHNLKPTQSLLDEGWFENKFRLAENFAITQRGLFFFYNQYEIKAYAAGPTEFVLPYSKIRNIIHPKGLLAFALANKHDFQVAYQEEEKLAITLKAKVNADKSVTIMATMQNFAYVDKAWFSLSFPQLHKKSHIQKMDKQGFTKLLAYPKGSKVYHNERKKAVSSSYLLIEGEEMHWQYDKKYNISLTINPPKQSKELIIDIRGALKSKDHTITLPNAFEGTKGQQGFQNYRVYIGL